MNDNEVLNLHYNDAYLPFFEDENEIVALWGGKGSGKSWAAAQKIIIRMLTEMPHRFLGVYKFKSKIRSKLYQQLIDVIEYEGLQGEFEKPTTSPLEIKAKNGNVITFHGLDEDAIQGIAGITGVWIEEACPTITWRDFQYLDTSIRTDSIKNYFQIILTYNPIDIQHWTWKELNIKNSMSASLYFTTMDDNPRVGADYERRLDKYKNDEAFYKMARYGEPMVISEATIFRNWHIYNQKDYPDLETDYTQYNNTYCGVDWGTDHASVCLLVAIQEETKRIIVFDEVYLNRKIWGGDFTNSDFITEIKKRHFSKDKDLVYYCDSEAPDKILELYREGINAVKVKKGKGSVSAGIDFLRNYTIIIMPNCKNLIEQIGSYSYIVDEKTQDVLTTPAPHQNDDTLDALRYSINSFFRRFKNTPEKGEVYDINLIL